MTACWKELPGFQLVAFLPIARKRTAPGEPDIARKIMPYVAS